jgi:arabinose-5-phosphate isomerase
VRSIKPKKEGQLDILEEIGRVIDIEVEGLQSVREHLTEEFAQAVELVQSCSGQVFVTGVGKSGIIANKIAATLRSTGTPAMFMHAGDGLHGDVGMIGSVDLVMAIGKSGESSELNALLRAVRKNGTRIIAITSNGASSMASLADIILDLRVPREACPLNLAPTASTTAALAVGDAIAVTLMKLKDVSEEDFARHHPAGQLGRRLLLTVSDLMRKGPDNPVIGVDRPVREMLVQITAYHVGAISVIAEDGSLLGLVTDFDIRRALEADRDIFRMSISDLMNPSPLTVLESAKAVEALETMRRRGEPKPVSVLPVVDAEGMAVGMLHLHNLIEAGL